MNGIIDEETGSRRRVAVIHEELFILLLATGCVQRLCRSIGSGDMQRNPNGAE